MKKIKILTAIILLPGVSVLTACYQSSHKAMVQLLKELNKRNYNMENPFNPEVKLAHIDSLLKTPQDQRYKTFLMASKAALDLKAGKENESVKTYEDLMNQLDYMAIDQMMPQLGIAYMRQGERSNCMLNHNGSSCIFPIKDGVYTYLKQAQVGHSHIRDHFKRSPDDLESKWLLNIAFMTLGKYPKDVPAEFLIPTWMLRQPLK